MASNKYRVVIAEDEYRIRENIAGKIPELHPAYTVSASVANGRLALEQINRDMPDLLITDIKMPVMDGLELIEELYFSYPELPVVILSGYDDFDYAKTAIHFGVKDYLLKPASRQELSELLQRLELVLSRNRGRLEDETADYDSSAAAVELCGKITEYIKENYRKEISITAMADDFHLNPTYMSRVFKARTGRTPTRYLTELRINRARKLLIEKPELEIKSIAIQLGFQDQNYFSRLFKKETGRSPVDFRQAGS